MGLLHQGLLGAIENSVLSDYSLKRHYFLLKGF